MTERQARNIKWELKRKTITDIKTLSDYFERKAEFYREYEEEIALHKHEHDLNSHNPRWYGNEATTKEIIEAYEEYASCI